MGSRVGPVTLGGCPGAERQRAPPSWCSSSEGLLGVSVFPWNDECAVPAGDPSPGRVPADTRPSSLRGTVRLRIRQPLGDAAERSGLPGSPDQGLRPARRVQTSVQASPQLLSWEGVAFVLQPRWPAGCDCPRVGVGALQLWAWQLAGGLPLCSPGSLPPFPDLVVTLGVFFFCSLSPRACVVFPSSSRAVEASFLQLPPALSVLGACTHPCQSLRAQGRCQRCSPALPFAPSSCSLRPLASGWGSRCSGPCPLPPAPLRLRRRF